MRSIFSKEFNDSDIQVAIDKVQQFMRFPTDNLQEEVDKYYNRI